jgi:hypothetical protein
MIEKRLVGIANNKCSEIYPDLEIPPEIAVLEC